MRELKIKEHTIKVSNEDFEFLATLTWCKNIVKDYFYCRAGDLRGRRLHRVVAERMGLDMTMQIDHINRDKFDNTRSNLRAASNGQNRANSKLNSNSTTGLKGVYVKKRKRLNGLCYSVRYGSQIKVERVNVHLGYFTSKEAAHEAYAKAAKHYYGEFANPNGK
jgi:hypothetical protein